MTLYYTEVDPAFSEVGLPLKFTYVIQYGSTHTGRQWLKDQYL